MELDLELLYPKGGEVQPPTPEVGYIQADYVDAGYINESEG